ncbi:MAG: hypothetical protein R3E66_10395 [bacterium]
MIDIDALFQETRAALSGAALVSFEWWARTARLAIDAEDWPTALDRLARLSDVLRDHADAQTALLALELTCCLRGNLPGRVDVALNRWTPGPSTALLRGVMAEAVTAKNQAALVVAKQVTAKAPGFGFGWAAQAEIQEQRQAWSEAAKSWTFAQADLGSRARIRAGIASLRAGDAHTGRAMLRDAAIGPEVFDWVVLGWASSRFWTDRLRAYDMLADAFAADQRAEPNAPRSLAQLRDLLAAVIEQLPLTLTAIEHERLSDLVGLLDPLEQASATHALN